MKLIELLKENRSSIQCIIITNDYMLYFKNDIEVIDVIDIGDRKYKIIFGDIILKLDEFQTEKESYFNRDKTFYFDLGDFRIELKLK